MLYSISVVGMLASVAASAQIQFYTTDLGCNGSGIVYNAAEFVCQGNPTNNYSSARLRDSPRADDIFGIAVPTSQAPRCGRAVAYGVRGQCLSTPDAEVGGITGASWNSRAAVTKRSTQEERVGETTLPSEAFLADGTTFDINNGVPSERTEKIMDLLWLKGGYATVDDVPAELVPFIKS